MTAPAHPEPAPAASPPTRRQRERQSWLATLHAFDPLVRTLEDEEQRHGERCHCSWCRTARPMASVLRLLLTACEDIAAEDADVLTSDATVEG